MTNETVQLAEFICGHRYDDLPASEQHRLRSLIIDNVAASHVGRRQPWFQNAARTMAAFGGVGEAHAVGQSQLLDRSRAAYVNGAAVGAFESEHVYSGGHPSACAFPALLALGEATHADGEAFVAALTVGYEVTFRVGLSLTSRAERVRGFHVPAHSGVIGAAAACARLLGLSVGETLSALGIAGSSACGLVEFAWEGSETKRIHLARSAQLGLEAAMLAANGVSGPATILEGRYGVLNAYSPDPHPERLIEGLGTMWLLNNVVVKPFPVHGSIASFIPALDRARGKTPANEIDKIIIRTPVDAAEDRHLNCAPTTVLGAQYSLPYMAAFTVVHGQDALSDLRQDVLADPDIVALARRVVVEADENRGGKAISQGGEVVIEARGKSFAERAEGAPARSDAELRELCVNKLHRFAGSDVTPVHLDAVVDDIAGIERMGDVGRLAMSFT